MLDGNVKFERLQPFPEEEFYIFKRGKNVCGFVQKFSDRGWYWYFGNIFSLPFSSKDQATDNLMTFVATHDFDLFAKQTGTYNNSELTKGR